MPAGDPLGFLVASGLLQSLPPVYYAAQHRLRSLTLLSDFYQRPMGKSSVLEGAHGSKLVRHPDARLIPESTSMPCHVAAATALSGGVQPEFDTVAPRDLTAAIELCALHGPSLPEWRADRARALREIEDSLRDFAETVASFMSGSSAALGSHVNLPFMAACVVAIGWPDVRCVSRWFHGHATVGDIPDTGLFRPQFTDYAAPQSVLLPASNRVWNRALEASLASAGLAASSDRESRSILQGVERATVKELAAGVAKGPYTRKQLDARFGQDAYRAQRRFGVAQGVHADGSPKIRAIDNSAANGMNDCTRTHETISPPSFAFAAIAARAFAAAFSALRLPMSALSFGLDDMARAYRRIPVRDTRFTVFALWSVERGRVEYFYLDGHNFGFRSAVLNFNAFPHLVCAIARLFFAVPCDHFFDDFLIVDLKCAGLSGQHALDFTLSLLGQSAEPSKRKPMSDSNVGLGVLIDVSRAHSQFVVFAAPVQERLVSILTFLSSCRTADYMSPAMAASCRGKLGFIFGSSYYRFGRAALQPLLQREYFDAGPFYPFTAALSSMLEFLSFVLPSLPPLAMPLRPDDTPPLIVYTDAMFVPRPYSHPLLRIGWCVFCPVRRRSYVSHRELSPEFFDSFFSPNRRTYISQGEAVGACAPAMSLPALFRNRHVVQFQDNTCALSALINGYASKPDMAQISNAYHLVQFYLRSRVWLEWVPSAANIADLPSRLLYDIYSQHQPRSVWVPTVLPPPSVWAGGFMSLARCIEDIIS